jgi:Ca2+-binding RTX toxin-like protein
LGPGASHESTGASEIEIRIKVTPGHSVFDPFGPLPLEVYYFGSSGADVAIAGARGIDMNGDGDVDVKSLVAPIARYSFYGEAGPDRLSGAGSRVTGVAVTGQIVTRGGVGRDVLRGGAARDVLLPEGGADKVFGGDGDDVFVSYALDGADVLHGGPGHDVADFGSRSDALNINLNGFADDGAPGEHDNVGPTNDVEEVVGGSGNDTLTAENFNVTNVLNGGAGGDTFHAVDSGADTIDGGDDADEAFVDELIDTTANVENVHSTT